MEELERIIAQAQRKSDEIVKRGEICPTDAAPVIANNRAGAPSAFLMRWGFRAGERLLINARSETAASSPLFGDGMAHRRCLLPTAYYFEWEKRGKERVKYRIGQCDGLLTMAGIYRLEEGRPVFAILTRAPAPEIAFIHDRMPVLLPPSARADWLDPALPPEKALARAVTAVAFQTA